MVGIQPRPRFRHTCEMVGYKMYILGMLMLFVVLLFVVEMNVVCVQAVANL
jgi:hypothetical protein